MNTRSNSQRAGLDAIKRVSFLLDLAGMHFRRLVASGGFSHLGTDLQSYSNAYAQRTGKDLREAAILELGYGQRPFRMIALQSLGYDVFGVDLDASLYRLTPASIALVLQANGPLRAAKSIARRLVFDRSDYRKLDSYLRANFGKPLQFRPESLLAGDLGNADVWKMLGRKFDFIYSEDVFEHIPSETLPKVVENMAHFLAPGGVAVITPMIFTGISGAHDIEWFPHRVGWAHLKRGPAWGHLTGEASSEPDTYVNKLTRQDYRTLFSAHFDILEETEMLGRLGAEHLTPELRAQLSHYDEEELFSNNVRFVLR